MAKRKVSDPFDDYARTYQSSLEEAVRGYIGEINETSRALLNQLFIVAGGLIALSSPFVITDDTLSKLPHGVRALLLANILLSAVSISCGVGQFYKDVNFLRNRREISESIIDDLSERRIKTLDQLVERSKTQSKAGKRASNAWTVAQFRLLVAAGICFVAAMICIFFPSLGRLAFVSFHDLLVTYGGCVT
jgi:hypothetical protein